MWNLCPNRADGKVEGTLGMLEHYYKAVNGSVLAGPTYFAEMLTKVKTCIMDNMVKKGADNKVYHVLIIITDGCCHDMEKTKQVLVDMSTMPFSAVIIGVGNGDFKQMEELDADQVVLSWVERDQQGKPKRDE